MLNPDFKDMLSVLIENNVDFLLIGAYAMAAHGHPRATGDLDVWVRPTDENAQKVWNALAIFGAPLTAITVADLATQDVVFQIGVEPSRVDILTSISGVEFDAAWDRKTNVKLDDLSVPVIGRTELIENKKACGRPKDLADLNALDQSLD